MTRLESLSRTFLSDSAIHDDATGVASIVSASERVRSVTADAAYDSIGIYNAADGKGAQAAIS